MAKKTYINGDPSWTVIRTTPEYVVFHSRDLGVTRIADAQGSCVIDIARTRTDLQDFYLSLWELERLLGVSEGDNGQS